MNNWKHYTGSILLAGLLLQGCGDAPVDGDEGTDGTTYKSVNVSNSAKLVSANSLLKGSYSDNETTQTVSTIDAAFTQSQLTLKLAVLANNDTEVKEYLEKIIAENNNVTTMAEARAELAKAMMTYTEADSKAPANGAASFGPNRSILSKIKKGLVDILDSSLGDKITGAAFDVVLNSEGVTVFMLDLARKSQTITDVMINALDENWDLTRKMCPMLQENPEFGEKFVALADERPNLGEFFFEKIDATMYGCLTDAMILSSDEDHFGSYDRPVKHSTTGYMGVLLEKYATKYFIEPGTGTVTYKDGSTDQFAKLLFTTGDVVTFDSDTNTTTGRGDAVELVNEQFFYAMFRTPTSTDAFVAAMDQLPDADVTMFMDEIFLGQQNTAAFGEGQDTMQGYYNIIAIGSGMYEGIFGGATAVKTEGFGFGSYTNAFVGFAGLISTDRYLAYGQAFVSAGFHYAAINSINVWENVTTIASTTAQDIWNGYTAQTTATPVKSGAPARSGGAGIISENWIDDTLDLLAAGWGNFSLTSIVDSLLNSDASVIAEINAQAAIAYATVLDGNLSTNGTCTYPTMVQGNFFGDTVCGFHGLIQLAMQEDMVNSEAYTEAEAALFILPPFANLTWDFAYNAASEGVSNYWTNVVDAAWLANISDLDMMREYLYPSEDGIIAAYVPNWMLSVDWLKLPVTMTTTDYDKIDLNFDAGYVDVYFVSTRDDLATIIDFEGVVTLVDSSIVGEDAAGNVAPALYVYTLRAVSPEQTAAAIAAIKALGENLIGLDTDNAAQVQANATQG